MSRKEKKAIETKRITVLVIDRDTHIEAQPYVQNTALLCSTHTKYIIYIRLRERQSITVQKQEEKRERTIRAIFDEEGESCCEKKIVILKRRWRRRTKYEEEKRKTKDIDYDEVECMLYWYCFLFRQKIRRKTKRKKKNTLAFGLAFSFVLCGKT